MTDDEFWFGEPPAKTIRLWNQSHDDATRSGPAAARGDDLTSMFRGGAR